MTKLYEYGGMGGMSPASMLGPLATSRDEKLQSCWQEFTARFEALWLDIMDADEDLYEACLQFLETIRQTPAMSARAALTTMEALTPMIRQACSGETMDEMQVYLARHLSLVEEVRYLVGEFCPDIPRPPGAPIRTQDEYLDAMGIQSVDPMTVARPDGEAPTYSATQQGELLQVDRGQNSQGNDADLEVDRGDADTSDNSDPLQVQRESSRPKRGRCASVVAECFLDARDHLGDSHDTVERSIRSAMAALQVALPSLTDVHEALVVCGQQVPGHIPLVDVMCEWSSGNRRSDSWGYSRLHYEPDTHRLTCYDSNDNPTKFVYVTETVTDEEIAETIYNSLQEMHDASPVRIYSEARVVPALMRLMHSPRWSTQGAAEIIANLRPALALAEGVQPDAITVWAEGTGFRLVWVREVVEKSDALQEEHRVRRFWSTPVLRCNCTEKTVTIEQGDDKQEIPADHTDEDTAAALLTLAHQQEDATPPDQLEWIGGIRTPEAHMYEATTQCGTLWCRIVEAPVRGDHVSFTRGPHEEVHGIFVRKIGSKFRLENAIVRTGAAADSARQLDVDPGEGWRLRDKTNEAFMTPGMLKHFTQGGSTDVYHTCTCCGVQIPKYSGRYPHNCPHCDADMREQDGHPSKDD